MSEHKWAVGEVVRLKSGGPPMTVSHLPNLGYATCEWFSDAASIRTHNFAEAALEKHVEPAPAGPRGAG